jgi:cob(I)alamin adenosyltransferase
VVSEANRVLVFTGDGKGKTTAALGMVLRAAGHGIPALVVEFLKADARSGELEAAKYLPGVEIVQMGRGFVPPVDNPRYEEHRTAAVEALNFSEEALRSGRYGLVVLDEVCGAVSRGLVTAAAVCAVVEAAAPRTCVVLTGRDASEKLLALADTVTKMRCVRHGMDAGIGAQKGVEF